jgi:hypothetical protein
MTTQTFHIFVRVGGRGQQRITRMAQDYAAALAQAQADGFNVIKIRRAPTPPADNLARKGV